jgi:hypothetical protein
MGSFRVYRMWRGNAICADSRDVLSTILKNEPSPANFPLSNSRFAIAGGVNPGKRYRGPLGLTGSGG